MTLKNNELGITQGLKSEAMQQSLNESSFGKVDLESDNKIAHIMYNFLTGKINQLPSYDFIEQIINNSKNNTVSIACGLQITKDFEITIEEPVDERKFRIDTITPDEHTAIFISDAGVRNIDLDELPKFSSQRVAYLQKYLSDFYQLTIENVQNSGKSLK